MAANGETKDLARVN